MRVDNPSAASDMFYLDFAHTYQSPVHPHAYQPDLQNNPSHESGHSLREIAPFALVNDGLRWHVRAFDRQSREFRDFVITRVLKSQVIKDSQVLGDEQSTADIQWNRIVELDLVPHPDRKNLDIIKNYGMTDGVLHLKLRAAVADYVLRQWIVDCSSRHSLPGEEYRLWLSNNLALYGVSNAKIAPGYKSPDTVHS